MTDTAEQTAELPSTPSPTPSPEVSEPGNVQEDLGSDAPSSSPPPRARQIVSINDDGTKFELDEGALEEIFHKVPEGMKVAIFSVVGAFRTGKSFALDLFLRYLRYGSTDRLLQADRAADDESWKAWVYAGVSGKGDGNLEGNSNMEQTHGEKGFSWRAGRKRNTTGIWMWEEPFVRKSSTGEDIAVFLIDTQGMFDSETSQMLTASIFGLSTLLSSYQIYNVDKRVQEDNLQHLALFTEYGRMALFGRSDQADRIILPKDSERLQKTTSTSSNDDAASTTSDDEDSMPRPFQRLDFLVRDWQDFSRSQTLQDKLNDMQEYMKDLLASRKQKDLADTREQINACFDQVACFLLPHPGHEVTDRDYDGAVSAIDPRFLELLTSYLDDLFDAKNLFAKRIHGMYVTSRELFTFIKCYAGLFREASIFPEAKTLLEATAEANNVNMRDKAMLAYKKEMDKVAGAKCKYVATKELEAHHEGCFQGALTIFDAGAKMGRHSEVLRYRGDLVDALEVERVRYFEVNAERDPYKNLEFYIVPSVIALGLLAFRIFQDLFCYESIGYDLPLYDCQHVSSTLSHLYWAIIVFMLLITFSTGQVMIKRIKTVLTIVRTAVNAAKEASGEKDKMD